MTHKNLQLVWFRNDLRTTDNPALYHASKQGPVVALFCLCEQQWQKHNDSPAKLGLIHDRLVELKTELNNKNIPLKIISITDFTSAPQKILNLCQRYFIDNLYFNNEYPLNEKNRDDSVEQTLRTKNITSHRFDGDTLLKPGLVLNKSGAMFQVFTPFSKAWRSQIITPELIAFKKPRKQSELPIDNDPIPKFGGSYRTDLWSTETKSIHKRLNKFLQTSEEKYNDLRDFPAVNATSTLSPYLTIGAIGLRECTQALTETNGPDAFHRQWLTEIIWREFYRHVMALDSRLSKGQCFKPAAETIPWKNDQKLFECWCEGKTGFPIVDAGMRQLKQTGWMHNRLRMITASFLTKLLRIDWRLGEAHFMKHLIDGDFASNNGGWQWSASVGADSVPYFRIFNPYRQSERFDINGDYLRKLVTEIADINDKKVHNPSPDQRRLRHYPQPVIDYSRERENTLAIWKQFYNTEP